MTDPAICPKCKSYNIIPNLWNAGQDVCTNCGYADQVALFHRDARENLQKVPADSKPLGGSLDQLSKRHFWWQDRD